LHQGYSVVKPSLPYRFSSELSSTSPNSAMVGGRDIRGSRCLFETCIDDYGEIWINGKCDRERGAIQGFNVPQRVVVTTEPQPGQTYTIALLAMNGPVAAPGGAVFVRYAFLAFEWPTPGY